jgi:transcription initiation factor IIE alpha subunit
MYLLRSFGAKCIISLNEKYSEDGILQKLYTCPVCGTILYKNTIDSKAIDKLYERIRNRKNMLQKVRTSNKRKNNIASRRK